MRLSPRAIAERLTDETTPLRLTLLILLLRPPGEGAARGLTWLVAGLAVAVPSFARWPSTWLALAALVVARLVLDWPLSDNHIYLLGYWCLGVGLCLMLLSPFAALADMSRWLVGTVFLCAILWKAVLAPDFLDARFFRLTLVTDERFADLSRTVGGLSQAQLEANRAALVALPQGAEVVGGPVLVEPPALRRLGLGLTWGGLVMETLVAAAFLSPRPALLHNSRHLLLIAFIALTYAAAPVAGFGWLLAAMGLAQCTSAQHALRLAYLGVFGLVLVYAETPLVHVVLAGLAP
jgi:hypothetical protein